MATTESLPGNSQASGLDAGKIIDLVVKAAVILATVIYGCGFLVISLHQQSYGLVEASPFRPRVLAAGIWFLVFAALPFLVVAEKRGFNKSPLPGSERFRGTIGATISIYTVSSMALGVLFERVFEDPPGADKWGFSAFIILIAVSISLILLFVDRRKHFPNWLLLLVSLLTCALLLLFGGRDLFSHRDSPAAIATWFMVSSWLIEYEMGARSWKLRLGNWYQSLGFSLTALVTFSIGYYPQIQASWGGGTPISAIIYFAKDSPFLPNRNLSAKILDETDTGFYLIGANDKRATFIPRSAVVMVYYSDDSSGPFIAKTK